MSGNDQQESMGVNDQWPTATVYEQDRIVLFSGQTEQAWMRASFDDLVPIRQ